MSGEILTDAAMTTARTKRHTAAAGMKPLSVGRVVTGDLRSSRPYSFTIRVGNIVRVERYATLSAAAVGHAMAVADVILLGTRDRDA